MTVKELRTFLAQFPDDTEVYGYDLDQNNVDNYAEVSGANNLFDHLATGMVDQGFTKDQIETFISEEHQLDVHITKNTPVIIIQ